MIKEEKFSKFWKLKHVNIVNVKVEKDRHLIWPYKHWLRNILEFSFEQKVIQKHPRILRLKASRLKRRDFSGLLNRILKRDFYILGLTQGSEGKGAIRQLKLFLSSERIWLKIVQVSWTSVVPFYFVHPYSRRNIDELSLFLKEISGELCFSQQWTCLK